MPAYYLEIYVVALGLVLLLLDAFVSGQDKRWIGYLAIAGLLGVLAATFYAKGGTTGVFWDYYTYAPGSFAGFYKGLALVATVLVILMGCIYLPVVKDYTGPQYGAGEFFALPVFTCAGLMWMASSTDLISIFVSLELVTISFYVLVAFTRRKTGALEAGVKYLILGALSTAFMVYGITWLFGATGTTNLETMREFLATKPFNSTAVLFGFVLLLVALGFKVGAFPFQIWIPDVYQGAPAPVTAFLSVASKSAAFIVFFRILEPFQGAAGANPDAAVAAGPLVRDVVQQSLGLLAAGTIIFASCVAIVQTNFKRLMAYSSIAHTGILLVALCCAPAAAADGAIKPLNIVSFYLASYLVMSLLAFLIITIIRVETKGEDIAAYNGLGKRAPFLAFALLIAMAGLASIPLTAGFFGKFFVFQLAVQAKAWWLLAIAVAGSAAGFYYYLKVVRAMYFKSEAPASLETAAAAPGIKVGLVSRVAIVGLMAAIVWFGVNPKALLNLTPVPPVATAP